jgi:hypothetical protein
MFVFGMDRGHTLSEEFKEDFNMRKILLMTTGLAWLALTGAAGAAVTVTLTPGPLDPLYFEPEAVGLNHFSLDGIAWTDVSGAADTERGNVAGVYAAPEGMGTSTTTGTTYMAVEGGGTEMATFATPQTRLSPFTGARSMGTAAMSTQFRSPWAPIR